MQCLVHCLYIIKAWYLKKSWEPLKSHLLLRWAWALISKSGFIHFSWPLLWLWEFLMETQVPGENDVSVIKEKVFRRGIPNHNFFFLFLLFFCLFSLQPLQCGKGAMIVVQYSHHYCTEASLDRILLSFQFANDPCLASDSKVCMWLLCLKSSVVKSSGNVIWWQQQQKKKISDFIQSMAISSHRNCITNYSGGGFDKYSSKL